MLKGIVQKSAVDITAAVDIKIPGIFRTRAQLKRPEYSGPQAYSKKCQKSAIERFTEIMQIDIFPISKCG